MKRHEAIHSALRTALLVPAVAFGLACATSPNPALQKLRASYQEATADTEVSENAPLQLHEARKALDRAEQAWGSRRDEAETAHLAYLANRRIEIARTAAAAAVSRAAARELTQQRGEILLTARTREVGQAMRAAESARREAEERGREAELARMTAEEQSRAAAAAREEAELARQEAQKLAEEERRLREALAELEARPTDRGMVLTLGDVLFAFDQSDLQPGAMQSLYRLTRFLEEYPDRELLIEGHTDSIGSAAYNADLSRRRADAVRSFLESQGISGDRVVGTGLGKAYPVATNDTAEGRQRNRRVEIVILEPGQHAADHVRTAAPPAVSAGP